MTTQVPLSTQTRKPLAMSGLYPATITPFAEDGSVDFAALERHLANAFAARRVSGVVVNSGIGELLQLQPDEMTAIIKRAIANRNDGQLVIAGVEGHNPNTLVARALDAKEAGADALLVLPAFDRRAYRRLNSNVESVHALFSRLDQEVGLPMVVFQYPTSSGSAYSLDVLEAIAGIPDVVAVKTATEGNFESYKEMWDRLHDKMAVLVGVDSPPLIDMLRYGAHGALIGISAIATDAWGELLDLVEQGDDERADALYQRLCLPLMAAVFQNQKPTSLMNEAAATKEALYQMGDIPLAAARFPAVMPNAAERKAIHDALAHAGLISG